MRQNIDQYKSSPSTIYSKWSVLIISNYLECTNTSYTCMYTVHITYEYICSCGYLCVPTEQLLLRTAAEYERLQQERDDLREQLKLSRDQKGLPNYDRSIVISSECVLQIEPRTLFLIHTSILHQLLRF